MPAQQTLRCAATASGVGVHSGVRCRVTLEPAPPEHGLRIVRADHPGATPVPIDVCAVVDSRLATVLGGDGWRVATVEHLLAALRALGVDNALLAVEGPEIPVLDGSALPWVELLRDTGLLHQDTPRKTLVLRREIAVADGARAARLAPCATLRLEASIHYPHPSIGSQKRASDVESFATDIAPARTYGFLHEVEAMRAAGLGRGGSLDNAVVYGPEGPLNPGGLRFPDEPVRHKLLDMVGDLALVGMPVRGCFSAHLPGHALNARLVRALLDTPDAWEIEV